MVIFGQKLLKPELNDGNTKRQFILQSFDPSNGLDRSCEATIYPVLDKPPPPELVTTEERYGHFSGLLHNLYR